MLIVADENIPLLEAFFGDVGEVRRVSGRTMSAEDVRDADVLLVRSVTRVNRALLEGSAVRFVGTTTIGTDHVDLDWLDEKGVRFAAAPGCNANSVAEYVLSVLSLRAERLALDDWSRQTIGIVGVGNVGRELADKLVRLGFKVKLCDPPRAEQEQDRISPELVDRVWLATPHIAGYSLEGKVRGTEMIYQAMSKFLGLPTRKTAGQFLPEPALSKVSFTSAADEGAAVRIALRACYDPRQDDARLRQTMRAPVDERGAAFDLLRRDYPVRRECCSLKVQLKGTSKSLQDSFRAIGFKLKI